jgi:hypothetical protein
MGGEWCPASLTCCKETAEKGDMTVAGLVVRIHCCFGFGTTQIPVGINKKVSKTNARVELPYRKLLSATVRSANHW